nr:7TM-DISM domain-containing protein [Algoriphagus sp.]
MKKIYLFLTLIIVLATSCSEKGADGFSFVGWTTDVDLNGDVSRVLMMENDQFVQSESSFLGLGYADHSFWIKLIVNPEYKSKQNLFLEISNPMLNEIQIYSSKGLLLKEL